MADSMTGNKLYYTYFPVSVQQIIANASTAEFDTTVLQLYLHDDGSPVVSAAAVGEYVGQALAGKMNVLDLIHCVAAITEATAGRQKNGLHD